MTFIRNFATPFQVLQVQEIPQKGMSLVCMHPDSNTSKLRSRISIQKVSCDLHSASWSTLDGQTPEPTWWISWWSNVIYQHPSTVWFQFHQKFTISHTCCLLSDCWCSGNLNNKHIHIKSPTRFVAFRFSFPSNKTEAGRKRHHTRHSQPPEWVACRLVVRHYLSLQVGLHWILHRSASQRWKLVDMSHEWHCWPLCLLGSYFFCLKNGIVFVAIFSKMIVENSLFAPHPQIKWIDYGTFGWM